MNRLSVGNTSQGSFCQSNTKEAAEERNVPGYKEPLYSQRNYYNKNDKDDQYNQSQLSCSYAQQNYEQGNNLIEQEQNIECDWKMDFNEQGCNAEQIEEFVEGVSKIRTPYPSKKIKIKFQPNRQTIEKQYKQQNKSKYVVKINSEKCILQKNCSQKTGRKQIKLRSSRKKNQNGTNVFNSEKAQQNNINRQDVIQLKTETHKQSNKNNGNPDKSKTNLNYTQAINFCIASATNPNKQNQSNTKSSRDVLRSSMIDQQNVIRQNNDTASDLKKDRMSSAKEKSIENKTKTIKIINNFIEDELSQSETEQQSKQIKNNQRNELKILKVQKISAQKQVRENKCQDQTLRERQRRRKGSDENGNENKFCKQEEQSQKQVEIKCFKKKKQTNSQISTNYQSKNRQEGTSIANNQKRNPDPEQYRHKSEVRVAPDQSQNPQQYLLSPSHISQPFIEQSYISKVISEMMMQNNEYLHRVNESVVNRLLSIIENQSQNGHSMISSMKNSRWNEEPLIKNNNSRQQSFHNYSNMKGKVARMQHNKSKSHQIQQTSPKLQKNPQYSPTTHIQQNGPLQILGNMQSKPSSIMVSVVNQNSQAQQMATQPSGSLNSTLKEQQLNLIKLQCKRNRRSREFVQQREKQKYGPISDAQKINDFAQTPRPNQPVGTNGNKNSDPNLKKNAPIISPIHNIQYEQESQKITPCVSHNVSLANDNNINENVPKKGLQDKQKVNGNSHDMTQNEKISIQHKKPVFMEISKDEQSSIGGGGISLAQAFKKKIGKLPSKQERKAKQMQNQQNDMPKDYNDKQLRPKQLNHETAIKNTIMTSSAKPLRQTLKKQNTSQNHCQQQGNASTLQIDTQSLKGSKGVKNMYVTPKSCEPSEQLLNRLIGGSKAKISKKEMYALTRKNYQNLPEVRQKKRQEEKKQKQIQRLERIKQYQKSIRASKVTITSNSNN